MVILKSASLAVAMTLALVLSGMSAKAGDGPVILKGTVRHGVICNSVAQVTRVGDLVMRGRTADDAIKQVNAENEPLSCVRTQFLYVKLDEGTLHAVDEHAYNVQKVRILAVLRDPSEGWLIAEDQPMQFILLRIGPLMIV